MDTIQRSWIILLAWFWLDLCAKVLLWNQQYICEFNALFVIFGAGIFAEIIVTERDREREYRLYHIKSFREALCKAEGIFCEMEVKEGERAWIIWIDG